MNQKATAPVAIALSILMGTQPAGAMVRNPFVGFAGMPGRATVVVIAPIVTPEVVKTPIEPLIDLAMARDLIAAQLVGLGRAEEDAAALAGMLTQADLDVLLAHPNMMQEAGADFDQRNNLIMGLLVLGGLIALAAAGDGTIIRN